MDFDFDLELNSSSSGSSFEEESEDNIGYKYIVPNNLKNIETVRSGQKDIEDDNGGNQTDEDDSGDSNNTIFKKSMHNELMCNVSTDNNTTMNFSIAESENGEFEEENQQEKDKFVNSTSTNGRRVSFLEDSQLDTITASSLNNINRPSEYRNVIKLIPEILISKSPMSAETLSSSQRHHGDKRNEEISFFNKIVADDFSIDKNNLNEFVSLLIKDFKKENVGNQIIRNFQLLNEKSIQEGKKFKSLKEKLSNDLTNSENKYRSLQEENLKYKEIICSNELEIRNLKLNNYDLKNKVFEVEEKDSKIINSLKDKLNNVCNKLSASHSEKGDYDCNSFISPENLDDKLDEILNDCKNLENENQRLIKMNKEAEIEKKAKASEEALSNASTKLDEKNQHLSTKDDKLIDENFNKITIQIDELMAKIDDFGKSESSSTREILTFLNCKLEQKDKLLNDIQHKDTELQIENLKLKKDQEKIAESFEHSMSSRGVYYKQLLEIVETYLKNFIDERSFVTFEMKKKQKNKSPKGILFGEGDGDCEFLESVNEFFQRCFKMVYCDSIKKQERIEYLESNLASQLEKEERKSRKSVARHK